MSASAEMSEALVSVVIPCYNQSHFLAEAIESVLQQSWPFVEVIVVDDGSTDATRIVATKFKKVKYIYQENQGVSRARNTGIRNSRGQFLVFLDADDWLYPDAIVTNVQYLFESPNVAFVSGAYNFVDADSQLINETYNPIYSDHYLKLLEGNYIGSPAAVMYQRWVFVDYQFDDTVDACADYDIYLKIARAHPVIHQTSTVAAYRKHNSNMSSNITFMLSTVLIVLQRQRGQLRNEAEEKALERGVRNWKRYYAKQVLEKVLNLSKPNVNKMSKEELTILLDNIPVVYNTFFNKHKNLIKNLIKKIIPDYCLQKIYIFKRKKGDCPRPGEINLGDFDRLSPFSKYFGYERGGAVDRYYIECFLQQHKTSIKGRVLEIENNDYTKRYGTDQVSKSDVLHVNENNPKATFVGDLSNAPQLPTDTFDCIILTQTLHLIYDFKGAIRTCYRILKPGGVLLLTVPGISHIDYGEWKNIWFWSFTKVAMGKIVTEVFSQDNVDLQSFGNVFVATAYLYGMGLPELRKDQIDYNDPQYQVVVTVKAVK